MFALLFVLTTLITPTQSDTTHIKSKISSVTVFQNQAQIHRTHSVSLSECTTVLVFKNLSESLISESVQLTGSEQFTLLSMNVRNNFEEKNLPLSALNTLIDQKEAIEDELVTARTMLSITNKEVEFIDQSKKIVAENKLTAPELNQLLTSYRENLTNALQRKDAVEKEIRQLKAELLLLEQQINENGRTTISYSKEVVATIAVEKDVNIEFELNYLVNNAGWYPAYDIRSNSISEPIQLTYKANIFQITGHDWNGVNFTINSGDPSSNSIKPTLNTQFLNYFTPGRARNLYGNAAPKARNQVMRTLNQGVITGRVIDAQTGEPLPSVTITLEGTSIGRATDTYGRFILPKVSNGAYSLLAQFVGFVTNRTPITIQNNGYELIIRMEMDVIGLEEVVVSGIGKQRDLDDRIDFISAAPLPNEQPTIIQNAIAVNQTSFSYTLSNPYTVPGDGKTHTVDIKRENIASNFTYGSVPKLSESAYLEAKVLNSSTLNLLAGEANVYFENRFVGSSFLDPGIAQDSISVSLGKDEQIVVSRKQLSDFSSKNFFRSKVRELQMYEITVKNTKNETVSITIEDQVPISGNQEIDVKIKELSNGVLNEETGIVQWKLNLGPGELVSLRLGFEIEYEKGKRLNLH